MEILINFTSSWNIFYFNYKELRLYPVHRSELVDLQKVFKGFNIMENLTCIISYKTCLKNI